MITSFLLLPSRFAAIASRPIAARTGRSFLAAGIGWALLGGLRGQPVEIVPPVDAALTQSLDGPWKFRYVAGPVVAADAFFIDPSFDAAGWATLAVPAHWDMNGFVEPKFPKVNDVDEGTGYYRRTFRVPDSWRGQRVMLRFEGVFYGLETWVNGTRVGEWASAFNPVTFDLTDALKPGAENILAVRVTTRPKGWEFDTNDCWALSGIYREVTLYAVPATHLQRTTARTVLTADGSARLQVAAELTGATAGAALSGRLRAPTGEVVREFALPLTGPRGETEFEVPQPRLWTAETPHLYTLELTLSAAGQPTQALSRKIGLRQVTTVGGVLRLNGVPIKLRGVDHHDIWPETGRVATEANMRRDLALIGAANCNFIRTAHYPPHPRLLELCDELGFYVMDEVPFGFGDHLLTDPGYQDILLTRARATVLRDENHPSVIVWSVGNENPNTPLTFATAARVKELDPTRPVCFPQTNDYFEKSHHELPAWVDIYAPHYPTTPQLRELAARLERPIIFTEYAHAMGLAGDQVDAQWKIMEESPRVAGGAIWMFQDQGILRSASAPMSAEASRLAVMPDAGHVYDTAGNLGMDGIVYSDRTPQPDYWHVRKVYSPIQIAGQRLTVAPGGPAPVLVVENHFDFRALTGITLHWELQRNGARIQGGEIALGAAARARESVSLPINVPAESAGDYFAVAVKCIEGAGASFYERTLRLDLSPASADPRRELLSLPTAAVTLDEQPATIRVTHARGAVQLDRATGEFTFVDRAGTVLATGLFPHAGRRFTEGERRRMKGERTWPGSFLRTAADLKIETSRASGGGVVLAVRGRYPRPDAPEQALAGVHQLTVHPNGTLEVSYDYQFIQVRGHILEAGLSLLVPVEASSFRWIGAGPHAGYPGKDRLNEFGLYHLHRDDLRFQGNRREVDLALLARGEGTGLALFGPTMDVAVERDPAGTVFSHNALVSGRGTKFVGPDTFVRGEKLTRMSGQFTLLPLDSAWPAGLTRWLGSPTERIPVQKPFYRSYDE